MQAYQDECKASMEAKDAKWTEILEMATKEVDDKDREIALLKSGPTVRGSPLQPPEIEETKRKSVTEACRTNGERESGRGP